MNKTIELTNDELLLFRTLISSIDKRLNEKEDSCESDCNDQKYFSLKGACRELTKELINHRGELTGSERAHLLELIEQASRVMRFY